MAAPRWLNTDEDRAWRGWLAMSSLLRAQIARDLQAECGLSDAEFVVLVHLSEAAGGRMRMTALAGELGWSKSRVSHQCSRMEVRGLVAREGCPEDARSSYAVLTPCGRTEIIRAAPLHVESVRRHLIDLLDAPHLRSLTAITEQVVAHLQEIGAAGEPAACGAEACGSEEACESEIATGFATRTATDFAADTCPPPCPTQARPEGPPHRS